MNDELRDCGSRPVIGMDKRPEITLVTNKAAQTNNMEHRYAQMQNSMTSMDEKISGTRLSTILQPRSNKEPDYLDIPLSYANRLIKPKRFASPLLC